MVETQLDKLYKLIETVYEDLDRVKEMISKLQLEARKEALKDVPGVEGVFDGKYLITDAHEKVEVPANYAAKSRIVFGDRLKSYEDEGKQVFKQLEKVNRKKVDAVVSKKEGKFYALTESGSYELSPIAVEYNKVNINDKVQIIIPEDNPHAPYAALDKIVEQKTVTGISVDNNSKAPHKETNREFVMDLSAGNSQKDLPLPSPVVAPSVAVQNSSAPRSNNRSAGNVRPKRKPAPRGGSQGGNNQNRGSNAPKYPSRSDNNGNSQNNSNTNTRSDQTTTLKPFVLEDDDLR